MTLLPRPETDPVPAREPALDRRHLVEPEHADLRIQTAWRRIQEAREERRNRRNRRYLSAGIGGLGLAAAAAALLVFNPFGEGSPDPTTWAGATLRTGGEPTKVALSDGSEIEARPESELALLDAPKGEVRVALRRGGATFEVTRQDDRPRRFVVEAGEVEVRVLGTRFSVARHETPMGERRVEVSVVRGEVEVALGENREVRRLGSGERWSVAERTDDDSAGTPTAATEAPSEPAPTAGPEDEGPGVGDGVDETDGSGEAEPTHARRGRTGARSADAATLIDRAKSAGLAGDHRGAAEAYGQLLRHHRRDPRASLAAFELGRLRMDRLGDRRGAVSAFRTALRLGPRSPFRQDALRRLVELYEDLDDGNACQRLKQRYLEVYPEGRYAAEVSRRCATAP